MKAQTKKEQEAIRKARNKYLREWKQKNPEKKKEYEQRYWLKKAIEYGLI